jgi:hypothetical protein
MANQGKLLDPLGLVEGLTNQAEQMAATAQVPQMLRPKTLAKMLDPLGLFTGNNPGPERPGYAKSRGV